MNRFITFQHFRILAFASLIASSANGEIIMSDSFESGDMSATNGQGFKWANNNRTAVVTATNEVYDNGYKNEPIPPGRDWTPRDGNHSLKFSYPKGKAWAEQRFSIGKAYPEIWMSFWLRVPTNFIHIKEEGRPNNQKLFYLWVDGYSYRGEGSSVGMEFRGNGNGGSYFYAKIGQGKDRVSSSDLARSPFISIPSDRGRWMHLVVQLVGESELDAKDGSMKVWRKWENESNYTQTQNLIDRQIRLSSDVEGFAHGYLMGWANQAYQEKTEFLIDNFKLSENPLFIEDENPKAPTNINVE